MNTKTRTNAELTQFKKLSSKCHNYPDSIIERQLRVAYLVGRLGKTATHELINIVRTPPHSEKHYYESCDDTQRRVWAISYLGVTGEIQAIVPLINAFNHKKACVRVAVARALYNIINETGDKRAVPTLQTVAQRDPCEDVKFWANKALKIAGASETLTQTQ